MVVSALAELVLPLTYFVTLLITLYMISFLYHLIALILVAPRKLGIFCVLARRGNDCYSEAFSCPNMAERVNLSVSSPQVLNMNLWFSGFEKLLNGVLRIF